MGKGALGIFALGAAQCQRCGHFFDYKIERKSWESVAKFLLEIQAAWTSCRSFTFIETQSLSIQGKVTVVFPMYLIGVAINTQGLAETLYHN